MPANGTRVKNWRSETRIQQTKNCSSGEDRVANGRRSGRIPFWNEPDGLTPVLELLLYSVVHIWLYFTILSITFCTYYLATSTAETPGRRDRKSTQRRQVWE